jgi:hypothetical protein
MTAIRGMITTTEPGWPIALQDSIGARQQPMSEARGVYPVGVPPRQRAEPAPTHAQPPCDKPAGAASLTRKSNVMTNDTVSSPARNSSPAVVLCVWPFR